MEFSRRSKVFQKVLELKVTIIYNENLRMEVYKRCQQEDQKLTISEISG